MSHFDCLFDFITIRFVFYLDPNFELAYYKLAERNDLGTRYGIEKAVKGYEELINRFPKSKYMVDYLYALAIVCYRADWWLVDI